MKDVKFARERFQDMYPEMKPLLEKHWKEIAWNQDKIKLEVDEDKYNLLQDEGALFCFSVRYKGKLIGYAAFFLQDHPHYKSICFAVNDVIFLEPEFRAKNIGVWLIKFCEAELKALGAKVISLRIKHCLDWTGMAKEIGYESVEWNLLKWVGDEDQDEG